jgi:hypothetical protein
MKVDVSSVGFSQPDGNKRSAAELKKKKVAAQALGAQTREPGKKSTTRLDLGDGGGGDSNGPANVRWEYADLGNEKEPIYFVPPNTIYCNTSNDLYRFAVGKNRYYGPTWIRMLPYLSRIAVSMSNGSSRLRPDEFNLKVDRATRYFLKQKKIIQ